MDKKLAAIWARVSTDAQSETSIPSQIEHCKKKLESEGYIVPAKYVFSASWTSLELESCPEYINLLTAITRREVQAVGVYNRDRLSANYDDRAVFLSICRQNDVQVIVYDGSPVEDSDMGALIEHIYTIGKKQQVLRAQIGSAQGLYDRVRLKRLPVTYRSPYGYTWDEKTLELLPNDKWDNVKRIAEWLKSGKSYDWIIVELKKCGILSPQGGREWNKNGISHIVHNPVYYGRYASLKSKSVTPTKRRGRTYGKSSVTKLPEDQWEYLDEIKIINPPFKWEDRERILSQLADHQKLSQRNAKRNYLLRGFIHCSEHVGKNGSPRIYHGRPHHASYAYACSVGKCYHAHIPGPEIDDWVKGEVAREFALRVDEVNTNNNKDQTKKEIESKLKELQVKSDKLIDRMVSIENDRYSGVIDPPVYKKLKEQYKFESAGIENQRDNLLGELKVLENDVEAAKSLEEIRMQYAELFIFDYRKIPDNQWRDIFTKLNLEISVNTLEKRTKLIKEFEATTKEDNAALLLKQQFDYSKFTPMFDVTIKINIPIASNDPRGVLHNNTYPVVLNGH